MADTLTKTRRRFFRFSLRAMLLLVLVIGGSLGWTLHKVREQGVAVAELEEMGCRIAYAEDEPLTVLERLRMWYGEKECRNAATVFGSDSQLTDAGLVHLERLTQLTSLRLNHTQVTDAGLAHIKHLAQIQSFGLGETQVTDAGLAHLERLTQLLSLSLKGALVTDAGLVHLQRLTKLRWLCLNQTQVTDNGLAHLEGLTQLTELHLRRTQVTDAGIDELKKALPNLEIYR